MEYGRSSISTPLFLFIINDPDNKKEQEGQNLWVRRGYDKTSEECYPGLRSNCSGAADRKGARSNLPPPTTIVERSFEVFQCAVI
jgi:hypothetical protein